MPDLPDQLYRVETVVRLEQLAIQQFVIPAYELMKRAGQAVFDVLQSRFDRSNKVLVLCGAGNNAGDGYVLARLAQLSGFDVELISLSDPSDLKNEALQAYRDWRSTGSNADRDIMAADVDKAAIDKADIIIDALLGTGLTRGVSTEWCRWIAAVNQSEAAVVSVDLPSGLMADTGSIAGCAIQADVTVSFIGLKQGLFTSRAKDVCGEIVYHDLDVPQEAYSLVDSDARLISKPDYSLLPRRKASSHKGNFGHVLIVGGNAGMPGAIILAAKAALRTGAGLVTVLTVVENQQAICTAVPEAMIKTCSIETMAEVLDDEFMASISHIAIGMGLGQDDWSLAILRYCAALDLPMLVDADALNLVARHGIRINGPLLITPHPGEAARLLSTDTAAIQRDRFAAVKQLHALFSASADCVVILKGSGSIIYDGDQLVICDSGSAAMAAPGMGDVLSGITVALMAQSSETGIDMNKVAELAVCLHAAAACSVSEHNTRGLLASDVVDALKAVVQ